MQESYLGVIFPMPYNFAPRMYLSCEGQLLAIATNQALFSLLGVTYGGDGRTTFALPDLRGRRIVGQGVSPTLGTWTIGQKAGVENVTITLNQLPAHTHQVTVKTDGASAATNDPSNNYFGNNSAQTAYDAAGDNTFMNPAAIAASAVGGSQPVDIHTPYLAMFYCICTQGLFPPRP